MELPSHSPCSLFSRGPRLPALALRPSLRAQVIPDHLAWLVISKILFLVEQIRPGTTKVYNLRTPVPIFLEPRTLKAIEGV
jgi:hypothetical protein